MHSFIETHVQTSIVESSFSAEDFAIVSGRYMGTWNKPLRRSVEDNGTCDTGKPTDNKNRHVLRFGSRGPYKYSTIYYFENHDAGSDRSTVDHL